MTFDDFKEGFVAVLSQAIEQLSSSEDEDQPSDSTAGRLVLEISLDYFLNQSSEIIGLTQQINH